MPGSSTGSFVDADDYQASLADIFANFIVTLPGPFAARATRTTLRHLHLLRAREDRSRVAFVSLPPGLVFISFSADPAMSLIWRGIALDPGEIMLHSRGERLHQRTDGASRWGLIALSPASLAAYWKTETGGAMTLPETGLILRPTRTDRHDLLRVHADAARLAETRPKLLDPAPVVRAMEYELSGSLVRCLANSTPRSEAPETRQAAALMSRFEELLAHDPRPRLSLAELRAALGVSGQFLDRHCAAFLGVDARRYMQLRRLRLLRLAILNADPRTARIGELAQRAGFTAGGRLAELYRAIYGETPSAPLRRAGDA